MKCLPHIRGKKGRAFAIISTLLVIAILTIIVVAFMQSMRIDRLTSRAYYNKLRADLAAEAGLQESIRQLSTATGNDRAFVVEERSAGGSSTRGPVLCVSRWIRPASGNPYRVTFPLISTAVKPSDFQADFNAAFAELDMLRSDLANSINLNGSEMRIADTASLPAGSTAADYYRAEQIQMSDSTGGKPSSYAFVVLDEQARLIPRTQKADARQSGASAEEIALGLGNDVLLNSTELAALQPINGYFTAGSMGQIFTTYDRYEKRKHLFGDHAATDEDVIAGEYADAGKPKLNINDVATGSAYGADAKARAKFLADFIDRNLPDFKLRDQSFVTASTPGEARRYVDRIAASIVDYIDADAEATAANDTEPAGKDLYPMVAGIAENFEWLSPGSSPAYVCAFQSRYYLQLWNPYTQSVSGNVRVRVLSRPPLEVGLALAANLKDYDQTVANVTLQPNEYKVVEFSVAPESSYQANTDPTLTSSPGHQNRPKWQATSSTDLSKEPHPYFEMYWNGVLADMNRRDPNIPDIGTYPSTSGLPKVAVATSSGNNRILIGSNRWSVHFPRLQSGSEGYRRVTDPRINWLSNYDWTEWVNTSYGNAYWGGRQDHTTTKEDLVAQCLSRDYVRANANIGAVSSASPTYSQTPLQIATGATYQAAADGKNAPFYIRNAAMASIGELGHIFDPAQVSDDGSGPLSSSAGAFISGGGRSLRIGQPEMSFWDVEGKRAAQLLDLLTVNSVNAATGYPEMHGRVNVNTASEEVLRALFYNVEVKSDEGTAAGKINEAKSLLWAQALVQERQSNGMFSRLSDVSRFLNRVNRADCYEPPLGAGSASAPPQVMDRAREEAFSKVVNLMTVQSRAFRVYVSGQALAPDGKIAARSVIEAIVILKPGANSAGQFRFNAEILYQRFL